MYVYIKYRFIARVYLSRSLIRRLKHQLFIEEQQRKQNEINRMRKEEFLKTARELERIMMIIYLKHQLRAVEAVGRFYKKIKRWRAWKKVCTI